MRIALIDVDGHNFRIGMTENETIEILEGIYEKYVRDCDSDEEYMKNNFAITEAVKALTEIQQYRAIGTVERFQQLAEQFKPHMTDETSCPERHCNKCDKYRKENEKYHKIGTVEECQEAMEKQRGKKVSNRKLLRDFNGNPYSVRGDCPNCGNIGLLSNTDYCNACGQKLDWRE